MITRLHLQNFRRHEDTELFFNADDQLIAVAGQNGTGKSTILEALTWSLYGETRHGRRQLDGVIRRGAELEGAEVTVEFTHAGTQYRVSRRRVEKTTSAVLYADGSPICSSPTAVDAEIARIFGMDAAGFRLAVYARQKELDGLISMDKGVRRQTLARLLRIEAIGKAAKDANKRYLSLTGVLDTMGPAPDLAVTEAEMHAARNVADAARTATGEAQAAVDDINRRLGESSDVEVDYRSALELSARAGGALDAAIEARNRAGELLANHHVPDEPELPARTVADIRDELRDIDVTLAQAEAAAAAHADRVVVEADHADVVAQLNALDATALDLAALQDKVTEIEVERDRLVAEGRAARETADAAAAAASGARALADEAAHAIARAEALDATCTACGQDIPDEHRHRQADGARARHAELVTAADVAEAVAAEALAAVEDLRVRHGACNETLQELGLDVGRAQAQQAARADLVRRRDTYALRLGRALPELIDSDGLRARREGLTTEEKVVAEQVRLRDLWENAVSEHAALTEARDAAQSRLIEAEQAAGAAKPAASLVAAWEQRQALVADREAELELLGVLTAQAADASARVELAESRHQDAMSFRERYEQRATDARIAAHTKAVISELHDQLSSQLRPSLEGTVSELLARLSEGRFPSVRVTADYEIQVLDDGAYRGLGDLSGGESDLVALAVRLGLAQVVADRQGSDALGVLILDEVFGSQDQTRRDAILSALRELRGMYGQIFLISHVPGLEDAADKLIELSCNEDRSETDVTVS